jgi:Na+/H+-dicarboxylate symporter
MGPMLAAVKRIPLYVQVIAAVILGSTLGVIFKKEPWFFGAGNAELGELGMLVIRLLKALAVPLVWFAILDAFLKTTLSARAGGKLIAICLVNVSVAFAIGLTLMNTVKPGVGAQAQLKALLEDQAQKSGAPTAAPAKPGVPAESLSPLVAIKSYVPENLVDPFFKNNVIPVVLLALLIGAAMRKVKDHPDGAEPDIEVLERFVHAGLRMLTLVLSWVVHAVPFAVFGILAQVVGAAGLGVFASLGPFLGVVLGGFVLHALGYYPLMAWLAGGRTPKQYLGVGADAILTGLSTNSSLATVPITLRCLNKMGVSDESARLAACVGTNLNNDGITLYEAMAALFIAQAMGLDLSLSQQVTVVLASLMAGIGIAGIPEAGLVMLPLVLGAVGLPTPVVAVAMSFVLPVDWIIARCRSGVNVMSDMLVAVMLDGKTKAAPAADQLAANLPRS